MTAPQLTLRQRLLTWARTVDITVSPVPPDVEQRAAQWFGGKVDWNGMVAYVRHACTNYGKLLAELPEVPCKQAAYQVLKNRANALARDALSKMIETGPFNETQSD